MKVVPLRVRVCSAQVSQNPCVLSSPEHSKPLWLKVLPDPPQRCFAACLQPLALLSLALWVQLCLLGGPAATQAQEHPRIPHPEEPRCCGEC